MRNLRNIFHAETKFSDSELPLTATTWDTANNAAICAFGPTESSAVIEIKRLKYHGYKEIIQPIQSWDAPCPQPDLSCDKILSLHYFADTATICLVLAGGDLILVREDPLPGEDSIEIVGSVDAGITAAVWAPDEELLAITTRADTLLYMTRQLENITSVEFSPEDVQASKHVSVGWGKTETQFKGKRAKALRDPTVPEHVDDGVLSPEDDGYVAISWRGDGAFLAVSSIQGGKRRIIRVYSREGALDSVSEPVDGLEGALSWRPAGNLIAGAQRLKGRVDIVFFERNGLRHGQFSLPLSADELSQWGSKISIQWNDDSTVLAVCFKDRVQFWTMGNYHYYLKQEVEISPEESSLAGIAWHPEKYLRTLLRSPGSLQWLDYVFDVAAGSTKPPDDHGVVAVMDGRTLKLTPLRFANVPPPMALHEINLETNAVDVAFSRSGQRISVLHKGSVALYSYKLLGKPIPQPVLEGRCAFPDPEGCRPRQIRFLGDSKAVVVAATSFGEEIFCIDFDENQVVPFLPDEQFPSPLAAIVSRQDYEKVGLHFQDGLAKELDTNINDVGLVEAETSMVSKAPVTCPWTEFMRHGGRTLAVGLSINGHLYINDHCLTRNCTSFLLTPAHILFTTTNHLLKFIHMSAVEDLEVPPDEPEKDERCRSIERGAKLVTVIPSTYAVVLQMPRGNLETIFPRALVLAGIRRHIEERNYKEAFFACRKHRVDMNIIHDHAPEQFMRNVKEFIRQIKKVEHIDLFLSQLSEEDVSKAMYKETLKNPLVIGEHPTLNGRIQELSPQKQLSDSKINRICDAFLDALEDMKATNLRNIITANVCKSPADLDAGLLVLKEQDEDLAEDAAEHICFLADVNKLYDNALGLYNLELALLIAQQSQKDPREYLPYLQRLQEMSPLRRRFTIDDRLGRHAKALTHLHNLGTDSPFEEAKSYTSKHDLYTTALDLYKYEPLRVRAITALYATFLTSRNRFRDAGAAHDSLGDYGAAARAYRRALAWRECLAAAYLAEDMSAAERRTLAADLAGALLEARDFAAAATVLLEYLGDLEAGVRALCKGALFADATRVIALRTAGDNDGDDSAGGSSGGKKRRKELLADVLDAGLAESAAGLTELFAECKVQLGKQVPRLRELRAKKREDPLGFFGGGSGGAGGGEGDGDVPDNVSLAPTDASTAGNNSLMTRYTGRGSEATSAASSAYSRRTAKHRRKEERKRARGKPGSVYEEEYLVASVGRLIERVNSVGDEAGRVVEGLVRRGMRERAEAAARGWREVVGLCEGCVGEVFGAEEKVRIERGGGGVQDGGSDGAEVSERPQGAEGVLWDTLHGRKSWDVPVVKGVPGLCLL
ncbi:IKI3 family-domain-containing protein [Lineolata rhizophorae]|uniref:Elongator complex protein 1 n=1 Tax=Lineolata rhizophorae TaxID=578093 RepID=A0A6A6PCG2_9PEZI|nr:IKI3 family-domain-containing protein [Lineolata rhizophorae]